MSDVDGRSRRRIALALVDQVVASAAWYLPVLLVARAAEPAELGVFLVAYGALAMLVAVSRSMFGVVLGMDVAPGSRTDLHRPLAGVLLLAGATCLVLLVAALVVPTAGSLVALLGVASLVVLPQDLGRYAAAARGLPGRALVADLVWLVPVVVVLVVDVARGGALSAAGGLLVWVIATTASLATVAVARLLAVPRFDGLWPWWRDDVRRRHLAADSLLSGIVPVGNGWGAALAAGAGVVAAVRGAAMLFAPVATVMTAMTLAAVPEARRRTPAEGHRLLLGLTALAAAGAAAWGAVVVLLPDRLGRELLGASWDSAAPLLVLVAVEYVGLVLWSGGAAMLRHRGATGLVLRVRLGYAPLALALPVVALVATDDARGFAATLAVLAWIVGILALVLGTRTVSRD